MTDSIERILVIKLSALGDFIISLGAFEAIRRHHPKARITLLTTRGYQGLGKDCGYFDEIWCDDRPGPLAFSAWRALARTLRSGRFQRVYDLQRSDRSGWYFRLIGRPKPEWVGTVAGCSHKLEPPNNGICHITAWLSAQLALVGIDHLPTPNLDFMQADLAPFGLPDSYALLVPGSAPTRPAKRWPAEHFATLARVLVERGITPVLLGMAAEADALDVIAERCPEAINTCDRADLCAVAGMARGATIAIGNDTGPMHIVSAAGCPVISLFSKDSDPVRMAPIGPDVTVLQRPQLKDLPLEEVIAALPKGP